MISFGGSKSKSSPSRVDMWSPQQSKMWKELSKYLQSAFGKDVPAYPRQMYVPRTGEESAYLKRAPQLADEIAAMRARLGDVAYEINPETTEQYYQKSVKAPAMQEWEEIVEPGIREQFAGPGYWGSARAQAQQQGSEHLATELGSKRAELYYADEMARRQAETDAANREAQYGSAYAESEAGVLGTAGQYSRMIDQERVAADMQRWLMGEEVDGVKPTQYNPFLQLIFQALGLQQYALGSKSSSTSGSFGLKF
jgi:hypothetical protein